MKLSNAFVLYSIFAAGWSQAAGPGSLVPVLAELFTSEGCSSCPPADSLLAKLDQTHPVPGAQIIVLSEHVDYWNRLGWTDPFSSPQFSSRQQDYARTLKAEVYTPQIVIDGREQFVGSDARAIEAAVRRAVSRPKVPVRILGAWREGAEAVVTLAVEAAPGQGEVWIALADDRDESSVRRGENSGRTLAHVAVARTLIKVGSVSQTQGFDKTIRVPVAPNERPSAMRVVVFVAQAGGPVLGAGMEPLREAQPKP